MELSTEYIDNLQLINDIFNLSPLRGRYGVWGGLHLGIVREGRPLEGDLDVDFHFLDVDEHHFAYAVRQLMRAGFQKTFRFLANDGLPWEYTLYKDAIRYDFFRFTQLGGGRVGYFDFVFGQHPVQQWKSYVDAPLVPLDFLGRTWFVAGDADVALTALYGDWRTEDRNWNYAADPMTIRREVWKNHHLVHWN